MTGALSSRTRSRLAGFLFFLSGAAALIYELVWIRLFAIGFGNTAQAMSIVLAVYLGGIAAGAAGARRLSRGSAAASLYLYGCAELFVGLYAFSIPLLLGASAGILKGWYGSGEGAAGVAFVRALAGSAVVFPATMAMGATLPLLARWLAGQGDSGRAVSRLYSWNLAGAGTGVALAGFRLLPALGYAGTLETACLVNGAVGAAAIALARGGGIDSPAAPRPRSPGDVSSLPGRVVVPLAFLSGLACFLYEVAWGRVYELLFGPTASTITLILAVFLIGLTAGGLWAGKLRRNLAAWLCAAEAGCAVALLWALAAAGASPPWIAEWVRQHSGDLLQIEGMKAVLLLVALAPLTVPFGLIFPLTLRVGAPAGETFAGRVGGLYGINTLGCIAGSLAGGWLLIPAMGAERTLLVAGLINLGLALLLLDWLRPRWRKPALAAAAAGLALAALAVPRWDMSAMTAGAYKYAPYYSGPGMLHAGELVWMREGTAGTVAVRRDGGSLVLALDGKVDASDAGGDLLTEKLLAHLPLLLAPSAERMCLIGLASGVTAGAALTHPIRRLDVVEVSPDVVRASHFFDAVNRRPLADRRTNLILNDGRNHLALTRDRYDVIVSEPSNPWIAGMNNLFTRDFFRIARARLRPGGIFAQWFHIYNMPAGDLRSLVAAFTQVFRSAALWKLNDGDILLTGFAGDAPLFHMPFPPLPAAAAADLAQAGVENPRLLLDLYVLRDGDLERFAAGAEANTDDRPLLEFHGQRDLHAQTDPADEAALVSFAALAPPAPVRDLRAAMTAGDHLALGRMFERAESSRSAFEAYQRAEEAERSAEALAGMDRCARFPAERAAVETALGLGGDASLDARVAEALSRARAGRVDSARFLFEESALARPGDAAAQFNFGLFWLEQKKYPEAIRQFEGAIRLDGRYLPALEAMAESYLEMQDFEQAAAWSRRILEIDPNHAVARRTLAALAQRRNHAAR